MAAKSETEMIEALTDEIGKEVYIDVAKWHLYLRDAHLDKMLAEQLYPMLKDRSVSEDAVQKVLQGVSIKVGGGKRELSLSDLLPMQSQVALMEVLDNFQDKF